MRALRTWLARFGGLFAKQRRDRELSAELESHLQMQIDDNVRAGMPPEEARRQALIQLGGIEQIKETYRDRHGLPWFETTLQDIRFGLRMLRKNPGFTAVAVVTLALGIGANTAVFSVVNAVLLKPLPFPQPDRIVRLVDTSPQGDGTTTTVPRFMVWREQTNALEDVTAYDFAGPGVNLMSGDTPEQVRAIHVSADYFRLFGASVAIGRTFTADEDRPGGPQPVVITSALWRRRFASDPRFVGKAINLGGEPHVVIGVLGPDFKPDPPTDIYLPMQADPNSTMMGKSIFVAARLKPGITLSQAQAAMRVAAERYRRKFPAEMEPEESATAVPILDTIVGDIRAPLLVLSGAVFFVLFIACTNVANLQIARSLSRTREIAIRAALGAGPRRVIRQLLTENSLLCLAGGALGLLLGYEGVRLLLATAPAGITLIDPDRIPRIGLHGSAVVVDWRILAFTFVSTILAGGLLGILPAIHVMRSDPNTALRESGTRENEGPLHNRIRSSLAVGEIALTLVLLVGAFLMVRAFLELQAVHLGFDGHNTLTMEMSLPGSRFEKTADVSQVVRDAEQRIESIPGVEAAAYTNALPLQLNMGLGVSVESRPDLGPPYGVVPQWREVSPHFFEVFHIPVLRGRMFTDTDDSNAPLVALINQAMATEYWPQESPLGRRITIAKGMSPATDEPSRQIVGVVADFKNIDLEHAPVPCVYVPDAQVVDGLTALINRNVPTDWVIRTKVEPYSLNAKIQRELRIATGGLPVGRVRSMDQVIAESSQRTDFNTKLMTIFAAIGLLLAAVGIYGVIAYSTRQRTREIGIRMALGALPQVICNTMLLQGSRLLLIGTALGLAGSLALMRVMANLLGAPTSGDYYALNAERLQQHNMSALVSAIVLLSAATLLACWIPARRAMRVDPMVALRYE